MLVQPHFHPAHAELRDDELRDALGQRLDELELRLAYEGEQALGDLLVVDRVVDPIAARGFADVGRHFEIDDDGLFDATFPFPNADDALDGRALRKILSIVGSEGDA